MSKKLDKSDVGKKVEVVAKKKSEQIESVAKKSVQVSTVAKKSVEDSTTKKSVQSNAKKSEPIQAAKKSETVASNEKTKVSEVINLDSPVKEVKTNAAKPAIKEKITPAPGRSVSIVKIDEEAQEVKSNENGKAAIIVDGKEDAIKTSTQKLYDTRFEVFKEFCAKAGGGVDPMKAAPATIEKFLQQLQKEKSLGKSVVAGYKSAIVKIQSEHKDQAKAENPNPAPTASKPALSAKPVTRATITPVDQKPTPPPKPAQVTAAKSTSNTQAMTQPQQPKATPTQQQPRQQTPQGRTPAGQPSQKAPQSRDATPQGRAAAGQKNPQSQPPQKQTTPQSQTRAGQQQKPLTPQSNPRQQTPQSNPRQQTPQSGQRQQAPQAAARQTFQSNIRQATPQPAARQQTPQSAGVKPAQSQQVHQLSQSGTPRTQGPRAQTSQVSTPRQQGPQVRGIQPSTQPRQGTPQARQPQPQARQQTPQPRQQRSQQGQSTPQPRQQQPNQARQQLAKTTAGTPQAQPKLPQFTELPSFLKSLVNFPCKLETNAGGGPSLYRAAAQHTALGQDGWQELRRYCH